MADNLPLGLTWGVLTLHLLGERRATVLTGRPRDRRARTRAALFYAGLLVIFLALATPIDALAEKLLWIHMIQHMLLLTVAPPLIVLGSPWRSLWRPLPLGFRRTIARTVIRSPGFAPIRALGRALVTPLGALLAFTAGLWLWHLPGAYDLALGSSTVHGLEHITFLAVGILFWAQVTASTPAKPTLPPLARIAYVGAGAVSNVLVAMVLAFAPTALFAPVRSLGGPARRDHCAPGPADRRRHHVERRGRSLRDSYRLACARLARRPGGKNPSPGRLAGRSRGELA